MKAARFGGIPPYNLTRGLAPSIDEGPPLLQDSSYNGTQTIATFVLLQTAATCHALYFVCAVCGASLQTAGANSEGCMIRAAAAGLPTSPVQMGGLK